MKPSSFSPLISFIYSEDRVMKYDRCKTLIVLMFKDFAKNLTVKYYNRIKTKQKQRLAYHTVHRRRCIFLGGGCPRGFSERRK